MSVTSNEIEYTNEQIERAAGIVSTYVTQPVSGSSEKLRFRRRSDFIDELGKQYNGKRDIYEVLGYDRDIDAEQYRAKYERQDIARRIVELPAHDTWKAPPDVSDDLDSQSDTEFDTAFETLVDQVQLWNSLMRADVASGIGEYGLIFIGYADDRDIAEPVGDLDGPESVEFLRPFSQDLVVDWDTGRDRNFEPSDELFNRPVEYTIAFTDPDEDTDDEEFHEQVHHSRVIHVAEGRIASQIKGKPRLKAVYNRLDDIQKVLGSSAEMFWSGADQKYHYNLNTDDAARIPDDALDDIDEEVQKLVHDMSKAVRTINTDLEVIGGQEVNPEGVITEQMKFISGATGIPQRVLTGSERGELASSQDRANWFGKIAGRQETFAEPDVLRPLIDAFMEHGVLPTVEYEIEWPNLFELTELEQAKVWKFRAQAGATLKKMRTFAPEEALFEYMKEGTTPDFEDIEPEELPGMRMLPDEMQERAAMMGEAGSSDVMSQPDQSDQPEQLEQEGQSQNIDSLFVNIGSGDVVSTPDGLGVVSDVLDASDIEEGESVQGTDLDPREQDVYVVALVSGGHGFYTSDEVSPDSFDVEQPEEASEAILSANASRVPAWMPLRNLFISNDWSMPESWVESERPARLILLDAWASMGAQFSCGGGCCMGELHSEELCASMKTAVLGTELWRGGWV